MDDVEKNPDVKKFFDFLHKFDEKMISFALKEAKSWFKGKAVNSEILRFTYKPTIRPPKDPKYAHTMGVKVPVFQDGKVNLEVYYNQEHVPIETIKQNAKIVAILEPRSIYFIGTGNWGVTWSALQVKVVDPGTDTKEGGLSEYAFIE